MNFTGWSGIDGLLVNNTVTDTDCDSTVDTIQINLAVGEDFCAKAASGPIGLEPGKGAIVYFSLKNGTITPFPDQYSTRSNFCIRYEALGTRY